MELFCVLFRSMSTTIKTTKVVQENTQPETVVEPGTLTESVAQPGTTQQESDNVNKAKDDKEAERANDVGAEVNPSATV